MNKQKLCKGVQRFALLCGICIMAFLFVLTDAREAKASSYERVPGVDRCSLYSVTFEVDGKQYACDGSLEYIPVDPSVEWKDFFKKLKITDYKVLVDDCCSHVEDHKSIPACVGWKEGLGYETKWLPFCTYEDNGNGGTNTNPDVEKDLNDGMYNVRFYLDDDKDAYINIPFKKECQISYELNGGSFPEGLTVPKTLLADEYYALPSPVKSGSQFLGWKKKGQSDDSYKEYGYWNGTGEVPTYVAYWDDGTEPIDISNYNINMSGARLIFGEEEVRVRLPYNFIEDISSLEEGIDYFLSYRNNDKAATADSSNPPTVIIKGIGKYTGEVEKKFSISKSDLYLPYYDNEYAGNFLYLDIAKGKPLSSIDLSDARAYMGERGRYEVKGTFSWETGDYVPDAQEGDVLQNDSENGETNYNLVFTPDNQDIYNRTIFSEGVYITVKQGNIADCQITFESGKKSYLYTGEEIKPEVIVKDGDTTLTEGEDYEVSYAGYINVASSTDKYAPTVTIKGRGNYFGTQKVTYTISMSPEPPELTAVNETIKGKNDGSITGLTTDMEYRAAVPSVGENTAAFTPVTDTAMTLPTGAYEVRYVAEGIYNPSPVTTVVIQQGKALVVTLPKEQTGYTLTASENQLSWQGTTTLTFTLAAGYTKTNDFALEANVNIVDNQDGTYTISGVTEDVTVTVKGIAIDTTPTATPTASPTATPTASPTATPTAKPTASPTAKPAQVPAVGTKLKNKENKASYVVSKVKNNTVEVQYKTPVKKTKKVTITKTVTLSNGTVARVTSIANNAFKDNKKLQEITIGNNVTTIGKNAFSGCTNLKKVVIGTSVTTIGSNAFKNCKNLKTITIKSKKLKTLSKTALKGIPSKATIKVPSSKYNAYKKLLRKKGLKKSVKIQKAS
ncbi:MAG: leucine-rich repeat domain-containing protein [Eubacterium sp.]|nr:leucine-rich repeat domain-containing protein [Eubacterium sp.]